MWSENESAVMKHQLLGIMECWDTCNIFYLLKMRKPYKYHKYRLMRLLTDYQATNIILVEKYHEAYKTPEFQFGNLVEYPIQKDKTLLTTALNAWYTWVMTAKELYGKLVSENTDHSRFWKQLYLHAVNELEMAEYMKNKFQPSLDEPIMTSETTLPMSSLRREMIAQLRKQ